jgi:hypothetical protein
MGWLKLALKIFAGLVVLGIIAVGLLLYAINKTSKEKSKMVDDLAKIPVGSSVSEVIDLAQKLGFDFDKTEFAVPYVAEISNEEGSPKDIFPKQIKKDTDLSKFKNGKLNFSLSLFLFSRKGCEITFKDGKVTETYVWWLD